MSIQSAPFYWIVCDGCGYRTPDETEEVVAWASISGATEHALGQDWEEISGPVGADGLPMLRKWFCVECLAEEGNGRIQRAFGGG